MATPAEPITATKEVGLIPSFSAITRAKKTYIMALARDSRNFFKLISISIRSKVLSRNFLAPPISFRPTSRIKPTTSRRRPSLASPGSQDLSVFITISNVRPSIFAVPSSLAAPSSSRAKAKKASLLSNLSIKQPSSFFTGSIRHAKVLHRCLKPPRN